MPRSIWYPGIDSVEAIGTVLVALQQQQATLGEPPPELRVRDQGLLESALALPRQPYYPSVRDKAGCLLRSLAKNHPFVDGNKRMAFAVTTVFLWFNGYVLTARNAEVVSFMLEIAGGASAMSWEDAAAWIKRSTATRMGAERMLERDDLETERRRLIEAQLRLL